MDARRVDCAARRDQNRGMAGSSVLRCFDVRLGVALMLACAVAPTLAQTQPAPPAAPAPDPCAASAGAPAVIESVTGLGEIRLADGRLGRLADLDLGIDAVSAGRWNEHVAAIRQALLGLAVKVEETPGPPDRWGRRVLRISPAEGSGAPIHRLLVQSGLARVQPLEEQDACAAALLPVEALARTQGLGLWREPAARVVSVGETAAIRALTGRFAIVEGQILSVGTRPRRIYLNFGRDFSRDFTATLSPRTARLLEKTGIAPSSLRGKTVRVRGMVAARRAPAIEITGAGQIEIVR